MNGLVVRDVFPGNLIPASRFDPVAAKVQALLPAVTNGGLNNNFDQVYKSKTTSYITSTKIDHNFSSNTKVSGYYSFRNFNQTTSNPDGLQAPITAQRIGLNRDQTTRINYDYTIKPTLLLHLGAGYISHWGPDEPVDGVLQFDAPTKLGLYGGASNNFSGTTATGFPRLAGLQGAQSAGSIGLGPVNANIYILQKPTGVASILYVRNSHTFKAGGEWRKDAHTDRNVRQS